MIVRGIDFPPVSDRVTAAEVFLDGDGFEEIVEVRHHPLSQPDAAALNATMNRAVSWKRPTLYFEERVYTTMWINGRLWMSDHPSEIYESAPAVENARGRVLIAGLGLGAILPPILRKPEIRSVTVLERSPAVRLLVADAYEDPRLEVVAADAWEWEPPAGRRYDATWLDIWEMATAEQLPEIVRMIRRHRAWRSPGGWIGAWNLPEIRCLQAQRKHALNERRRRAITVRWGGSESLGVILAKNALQRAAEKR